MQTNQLDVPKTVEKIASSFGIPEFVWREEVETTSKLILLFDVWGSTDYFTPMMEKLFFGAKEYLSDVEVYYFHNTFYGEVWLDENGNQAIPIDVFLQKDPKSKIIIVGDAWMADYELLYDQIEDLEKIRKSFEYSVWINPILAKDYDKWDRSGTIGNIGSIFPMYDLSLSGIEKAIRSLMLE
jgi:hypothetical protein